MLLAALATFQVGCRVEHFLSTWLRRKKLHFQCQQNRLAFKLTLAPSVTNFCFDTDSFIIGIDTHVSVTMAKHPDRFDDLVLTPNDNSIIAGIEGGLVIKGHGTFKFQLKDNDGKIHLIEIPNSKYVPGLKYSLISPQHWVQEVQDHYPNQQGT